MNRHQASRVPLFLGAMKGRLWSIAATCLLVALLAVGCTPPAQTPASPTPPAPTATIAASPTPEAKSVTAAATPTLVPTAAPAPTALPSPTLGAPTATAVPTAGPTWTPLAAGSYPRVDGSTSTLPLQVLIACRRFRAECAWKEPSELGSLRSIAPVAGTKQPMGPGQSLETLKHTMTSPAYMDLIAGKKDLILEARLPSPDEMAAAQKAGVKLDARPVALDAFIFLLNSKNSVKSLELEQIRSIYTGSTANWSKLGGTPGAINAYSRERNSGSQELMETLVMKGVKMVDAPDLVQQGMENLYNAVASDDRGIGYTVYYYATNMLTSPEVKMAAIAGVEPTAETIANRTYPLVADVYVVVRADAPANSPEIALRDWMLSAEGQAVVAESGYVPVAKGR